MVHLASKLTCIILTIVCDLITVIAKARRPDVFVYVQNRMVNLLESWVSARSRHPLLSIFLAWLLPQWRYLSAWEVIIQGIAVNLRTPWDIWLLVTVSTNLKPTNCPRTDSTRSPSQLWLLNYGHFQFHPVAKILVFHFLTGLPLCTTINSIILGICN